MTLPGLSARNLGRNGFRTALTVLGAALAVAAFVIIRTVVTSYAAGAKYAAQDRVVTRHKVTFIMPLPRRYADDIAQVPGVKAVTWANWFGAKDPKNENDFFATIATESKNMLKVYYDLDVAPETMQRWNDDRKGALVGDQLMKTHGWKVGDTVHLAGTIYPGDWEFHIAGAYTPKNPSFDRRTFFFHWEYLNDAVPEAQKDRIGWVTSLVAGAGSAADASAAIDKHFDDKDVQTLSQDEHAFNQSFIGMFSTVLTALDWGAFIIMLICALILGNTIAMGVRERTNEYGVLRAIGFLPGHLVALVVGESVVLGLVTGALGALLGLGVMQGLGRVIEERMANILPVVTVEPSTVVAAVALALAMSVAASLMPAYRAFRLNVLDALRRIG